MPRRAVDVASLPEAERARREEQRAKRQVALDARASGSTYTSAKQVRRQERRRAREAEAALGSVGGASTRSEGRGRGRGGGLREGEGRGGGRGAGGRGPMAGRGTPDAPKKDAPSNLDLVIIPIYWKAQKEAKIRVVTAANAVHAALSAAGVQCEIDITLDKTPGQKFAAWEYKGVLTRVEVGPRDAEEGTCTLARTDAPGTPARRRAGVSTRADMLVPAVRALLDGGADALAELEAYSGPVAQPVKAGRGAAGEKGKRERDGEADRAGPDVTLARPGTSGDSLAAPAASQTKDGGSKTKRPRGEVVF